MKTRTKSNKESKQGISLIVLVITIIVMIILAGSIILTLSNNGIIGKASEAVNKSDAATVNQLAQMAWAESYAEYKSGSANLTEEALAVKLKSDVIETLKNNKINIDEYDIKVTEKGVTAEKIVVDIVDTVPIPNGFVASGAKGENTKDGGLVIYEGTIPVTDENVEDAKRNRNQYVWVPVEDFSKFVRGAHNNTTYSNAYRSGYWEVVLDLETNMPNIDKKNTTVMTSTTLAEVQAMYESVKKYKGFYIARYEAGLDIGKHKTSDDGIIIKAVHSKMNKAPYNYIRWTYNNAMNEDTKGAVEVARGLYPNDSTNTTGVISTLTYGVQWDRTLAWWVETKAKNGTGDVTLDSNTDLNSSTNYGNYTDNAISKFNTGASVSEDSGKTYTTIDSKYSKTASQARLLTTGATEESRVNNIYDMAGNLWEWTMEGLSSYARIPRGGYYSYTGIKRPVSMRSSEYKPHNASSAERFSTCTLHKE